MVPLRSDGVILGRLRPDPSWPSDDEDQPPPRSNVQSPCRTVRQAPRRLDEGRIRMEASWPMRASGNNPRYGCLRSGSPGQHEQEGPDERPLEGDRLPSRRGGHGARSVDVRIRTWWRRRAGAGTVENEPERGRLVGPDGCALSRRGERHRAEVDYGDQPDPREGAPERGHSVDPDHRRRRSERGGRRDPRLPGEWFGVSVEHASRSLPAVVPPGHVPAKIALTMRDSATNQDACRGAAPAFTVITTS